jgi:ssDNA-binding Zn-finger/Zn-ribbon topoisomerase 1
LEFFCCCLFSRGIQIECHLCGRKSDYAHLASIDIVTRSKMGDTEGVAGRSNSTLFLKPLTHARRGKEKKDTVRNRCRRSGQWEDESSNRRRGFLLADYFISFLILSQNCPECGHPKMYFSTMQLRSVDEGQTVFYECVKCHHKYSVNT